MQRSRFLAAGLVSALALVGSAALAASLFPNFPIVGGAAYCPTQNTAGVPGTAATCTGSTVPAGPTAYTGNEQVIANTGATSGPSNVVIPAQALGLGARSDVTSPATATIPALTPFYFLDGTQGSAFTITMPAAPLDGYIQHIACTATTVGVMTVAANTGQTLKNNPGAACTAGNVYSWVYNAANTTWYKF